jgi:hypothetical protein
MGETTREFFDRTIRSDADIMIFFVDYEKDRQAAQIILPIVLKYVPKTNSIIDFGCGIGTWSEVLIDMGFKDELAALDLPFIIDKDIKIPKENLYALGKTKVEGRGDLVIATRVDTIDKEDKECYIKSLCEMSNIILFLSKEKEKYRKQFIERGFVEVDCLKDQADVSEDYKHITFFVNKSKIKSYEKLNYWWERWKTQAQKLIKNEARKYLLKSQTSILK